MADILSLLSGPAEARHWQRSGMASCCRLACAALAQGRSSVILVRDREEYTAARALLTLFSPSLSLADMAPDVPAWKLPFAALPAGLLLRRDRDSWAGRLAALYGLAVLAEDVNTSESNTTRFIVISKDAILPGDAGKISLCFSLPHETGSLSSVLERFAMEGLNLTKIESRPLPGKNFEYDFYLDFTGNIHHPKTLDLICALQDELPRFSFLGNYSER